MFCKFIWKTIVSILKPNLVGSTNQGYMYVATKQLELNYGLDYFFKLFNLLEIRFLLIFPLPRSSANYFDLFSIA